MWSNDPLGILIGAKTQGLNDSEITLRRFLTRIDNLRGAASSEIDLRGPFAADIYGRLISTTGAMLDAFHAMRSIIAKNQQASSGELDIFHYTTSERQAVCARISHLFQGQQDNAGDSPLISIVLASSMKLEFPMSGALPSIEHAHDRLLARMFRFRQERMGDHCVLDEDFEIFYTFGGSSHPWLYADLQLW